MYSKKDYRFDRIIKSKRATKKYAAVLINRISGRSVKVHFGGYVPTGHHTINITTVRWGFIQNIIMKTKSEKGCGLLDTQRMDLNLIRHRISAVVICGISLKIKKKMFVII